ncbi:hypothetical protein BASA84_000570 [Batrachochytrium salamandrivorans]|nr:hypothetical protein BASA62_003310 [Batrachochytrium salamandrivorans]KAH9267678.1 hypothetical protein BASA84_000570 [Batrachochytrium salamandrivorans]
MDCTCTHCGIEDKDVVSSTPLPSTLTDILQNKTNQRKEHGLLRSILLQDQIKDQNKDQDQDQDQESIPIPPLADFSSNDYLGLSHSTALLSSVHQALVHSTSLQLPLSDASPQIGSTGSRLLSGNSTQAAMLESQLVSHYTNNTPSNGKSSRALLFNSGYDANLTLFSAIPQSDCLVLYDELIHASVHDGLALRRFGAVASFRHNSVEDVRDKVECFFAKDNVSSCSSTTASTKCVIVAVEAIYSMDGDMAPLLELANLARAYPGRVNLIVDEAHSTGMMGNRGAGLVSYLGIEDAVFARLHTFGKGMGVHGAVVIGPPELVQFLVNFGRPLIYSTMMSFHSLITIRASHDYMSTHWKSLQENLHTRIVLFRRLMSQIPSGARLLDSKTAIQGIVLPGNDNVNRLARILISQGQRVLAIRFPTVPRGTERVRICLHVHNTHEEIVCLARECQAALMLVLKGSARL